MVNLLGHFELDPKDKEREAAVGGALHDFFQKWGDGIELGDVQVRGRSIFTSFAIRVILE